ncbi:caspase-1-like isoform X1 [Schistocerca cancellata]|uniref:caspase-1-like isoform X1 n=2 Tax=Schistocerca cancellata TaxID=274614 RepID=UPI002117FACF|nr:caspase-1-like isoform X1 [Schistocerca cancellata]
MDVLACVCTAIATALTIFISEAIWHRHKSKTDNTKGHQSSASDTSGTKTYSSEAVQVPEADGLDSAAGSENIEAFSSYTDRSARQRNSRDSRGSEGVNDTMGEKDNLAKIRVVTSELTDTSRIVKSDGQDLSAKLERKVYIGGSDESDLNEVFFNFEKTAKEDKENNVDVVADNNRNHETETKCYPKRTRRMSDVIDSIGDSFSSDKSGRYSRKSSSSSPPATPPSDAGYSSVHSTPSHAKPTKATPCRVSDTTDAGCDIRAKYDCQGGADAAPTETEENETTDAGPISQQFDDINDMIVGGPVIEAVMPVGKHAEEYNMNHPRRGHAVIFNNDTFDTPGVSNRSGSDADVKNLNRLFTALDFEITVHHNKEYSEIKKILLDLSKEDHSDADCIVVTVLTHGLKEGYILSKDVPYSVDYLWKPFTADKCTTLAGKPKIFIVQACRGEEVDPGVKLVRSRTQTDSSQEAYKIPTHADFLIAYSSAEGFYSWRNPESGTWFIQCLCEELMAHASTMDLLRVLTRTARKVAVEFESFNDVVLWQHEKKQVPSVTTMLIRDVYFRPKK